MNRKGFQGIKMVDIKRDSCIDKKFEEVRNTSQLMIQPLRSTI